MTNHICNVRGKGGRDYRLVAMAASFWGDWAIIERNGKQYKIPKNKIYNIREGLLVKIDRFKSEDIWQDVKDSTMNTIGKDTGKYPESEWKRKLILSEHSPIRRIKIYWRWTELKYWVSVHFVRHKIGIEHWVTTQRSDRTGKNRDYAKQSSFVNHACEADAQALINISRKRLCNCASPETREAWQAVKDEVAKVEPELASCMVRECIYRGFCPEMYPCGYSKTKAFQEELKEYRGE